MTKPKFLLAYRNPPEADAHPPSPAEMQEIYAAWMAWKEQFKTEILDVGDGLKPGGKIVRANATTDGPLMEAKEVLGGYSVVQAANMARAVEIAKASPILAIPGASVEVRELAGF